MNEEEANKQRYLIPNRLNDVLAGIQYLANDDVYKRKPESWARRLGVNNVRSATLWADVFSEHPEFFRVNKDGQISLVWRRPLAKATDDIRPPLAPSSVSDLMNAAFRLRDAEVEDFRILRAAGVEEDRWQSNRDLAIRHWRWQIVVSILTALMAAAAAIFAAVIKFGGGAGC